MKEKHSGISYKDILNSDNELFTVDEIATALRVTEATVRRLIQSGELKALKFGGSIRITKDSIKELLKEKN
jgi:excisionase family DNA binding protein